MKKLIAPLALFSILMLACSISVDITPTVTTEAPTAVPVLPSDTPLPPVVPSDTPGQQANVNCNELSAYLDPALASGYTCQTVPESAEGIEIYPQYTELTLTGYLLSDKFFEPHVDVLPVQRYTELLPDFVPGRVTDLQALIGGAAPGDSALPLLPVFNAAQTFHAMYSSFPFASGGGIRFITLYAQYYAPINNHDLFYTYQGLTSDGKYWISALLPITNPILPVNAENPPGGVTWEQFGNNYTSYISDITAQLNAQSPDNYTPTFTLLDAFVASITIQP